MLLLTNGSSLAGIAALCVSCMQQVPVMAQRSKSFAKAVVLEQQVGQHTAYTSSFVKASSRPAPGSSTPCQWMLAVTRQAADWIPAVLICSCAYYEQQEPS
jgi:hypothetical protein